MQAFAEFRPVRLAGQAGIGSAVLHRVEKLLEQRSLPRREGSRLLDEFCCAYEAALAQPL